MQIFLHTMQIFWHAQCIFYILILAGMFSVPEHMNKTTVNLIKRMLAVDPIKRAGIKDVR